MTTRSQSPMNIAISCVALFVISTLYAEPPKTPPDLTQDRTVDRKLTYNLGPTGLRGWIYTRAANFRESQLGRTTTASRQILVTHVGKDLPADGVMKVDDVILGVGGKLFADDARQTFWHAITEAEKAENKGVLKLTCWRDSKTEEVTLKLRVIGSYSAIAPYDCPKSKVIFADACKALEKEKLEPSWNGAVSGLALLGTGNPEYLPRVKELAMKIELRDGMVVWDWGYKNVFLCECYQVTRDKDVLPAIQKYMASFQNREYGHTGQGFSCLWGALGANAGGPAAAAFVREATWHLDLVWRSEGSFAYDGGEQYGLGKTDDDTYYGKSGYNGLSPNACYVLIYSLPLKKLWITGKDANLKNWLTAKDVKEAVASGYFYEQREKKTIPELVAALGDWSPVLRSLAADEVAVRPKGKTMVQELIAIAEGKDAWKRQGAAETLGALKVPEAATEQPELRSLAKSASAK